MLELCGQTAKALCWSGEVTFGAVISAAVAAATAVIILATVIVANNQLRAYKATRIADILHRFSGDVYGHENVRAVLVEIAHSDNLLLDQSEEGLKRRAALAQLLDALCAVGVEVQNGQITLCDVAHSSIGYITARTEKNLSVNTYLDEIKEEHKKLNLPERGFSPFFWLADQLAHYVPSELASRRKARLTSAQKARRMSVYEG